MDGYGEYTWQGFVNDYLAHPAENLYCGTWKKGLRDGFGTFHMVHGSKYEGFWKNGIKVGVKANRLEIKLNISIVNSGKPWKCNLFKWHSFFGETYYSRR